MGKAPSFQFYPNDWRGDMVCTCSLAARGMWLEMMIMMHGAERYGYLGCHDKPIPSEMIARYCGASLDEYLILLAELDQAKVPRRTPNGIIYSKRMVEDEKKRQEWRVRTQKCRDNGGGDPHGWIAIRVRILERDNYMCGYCGRKASTVDHIIPKSSGGSHEPDNLVACCKSCNFRKSNRTPEGAGMKLRHNSVTTSSQPSSVLQSSPSNLNTKPRDEKTVAQNRIFKERRQEQEEAYRKEINVGASPVCRPKGKAVLA